MSKKKPGTFKKGADTRREPGKKGKGGRPSNAERRYMLGILKHAKTEAAILQVLENPDKYGDIWNRTLEWVAARANGPIPTVTATIASPGMAGSDSDEGGEIPGAPGLAAWPTVALMQMQPAPIPPAQ